LKHELNILLIDDNPDHAKILVWALEQSEVKTRVTIIDNGEQAIEAFESTENSKSALKRIPDLVFLDINLPNLNGLDLLLHIRKNPKLQHLPVIILSSSDRIEDVNAAYMNGANTYISKAQVFNEIAHAINNICIYWANIAQLPSTA
jgi:CheY-like chemotaxis protein